MPPPPVQDHLGHLHSRSRQDANRKGMTLMFLRAVLFVRCLLGLAFATVLPSDDLPSLHVSLV